MSTGIHTCHAECPCHTGGEPMADFVGGSMNLDIDSIADAIRGGERFRITVSQEHGPQGWWEATIYDLVDHGPTIPYAKATGTDLLVVMQTVAHYVYVAGVDSPMRVAVL